MKQLLERAQMGRLDEAAMFDMLSYTLPPSKMRHIKECAMRAMLMRPETFFGIDSEDACEISDGAPLPSPFVTAPQPSPPPPPARTNFEDGFKVVYIPHVIIRDESARLHRWKPIPCPRCRKSYKFFSRLQRHGEEAHRIRIDWHPDSFRSKPIAPTDRASNCPPLQLTPGGDAA